MSTEQAVTIARDRAQRVIELLHLLVPMRPHVVVEIEQAVDAIVENDVRRQICERLQRISGKDLATVEALTEHLDRPREPEPEAA